MSIRAAALAVLATVACNSPPTGIEEGEFEVVHGPPSASAPGWKLLDTIQVRLVSTRGEPLAGASVTWVVTGGGGTVQALDDATDDAGLARAVWTLGQRAGPNDLAVRTLSDVTRSFRTIGEAFRVDRLSSGFKLGCGLVGGALWCWGNDAWTTTAPVSDRDQFGWTNSAPGLVDDTHDFVDLAVSALAVCALTATGAAWCADEEHPQIAAVSGLPPLWYIAGAFSGWPGSFCGLAVSDSTAWCWNASEVAAVPESPAFVALAMDGEIGNTGIGSMKCGLLPDSTAACWGDAPLGDGSAESSPTPRVVSGGHRFAELGVGLRFACGREADGEAWCWGKEWVEYLMYPPDVPVPTLAATGLTRLSAGDVYAFAFGTAGLIRWQGATFEASPGPTGLAGLPVTRTAKDATSCVLLIDNQVYCYEELWDSSSQWLVDPYAPVQPVVIRASVRREP